MCFGLYGIVQIYTLFIYSVLDCVAVFNPSQVSIFIAFVRKCKNLSDKFHCIFLDPVIFMSTAE
jgi:hypothetical protein